jgi:YD repeat-containing protein
MGKVRKRLAGVQPSRRVATPRRLTYGRYRALLLIAILVIPSCVEPILREEAQRLIFDRARPRTSGAPGVPNTLSAPRALYQAAPPAASGAHPPYPLNHTFDAETVSQGAQPNADFETPGTTAGTPPTNHDLSTASIDTGAPPTNFDFATGSFSGWTTTGTPTIQTTSGPDGTWAQLDVTTNESLTSDAFTVAADAQGLTFDLGYLTTSGTTTWYVYDEADQLQQLESPQGTPITTLNYDANGNRIEAGPPGGPMDTYLYDWDNRLTEATIGGTTTDFTYAADGSRLSKTSGSTTTDYVYDRAGGLAKVVDDGTTSYLWSGRGLLGEISDTSGTRTDPLLDGIGSTRVRSLVALNGTPGATYVRHLELLAFSAGRASSVMLKPD